MRLALQVPNFTYPDVADADLFETVATVATTAEASGFDTLLVMDHFYQLPMLGSPDQPMFEAYTLLSALAARTSTIQLGTLVTGVTYRNPAFLAKVVTDLDVISRGRAMLGIGAAWFDTEHDAFGYEFPSVSDRFEMLEEAIQITQAMFADERPTFEGKHFQVGGSSTTRSPIRRARPADGRRRRREEDPAHRRPVRRPLEPHLRPRRGARASSTSSQGHLGRRSGGTGSEIGVSALNFLHRRRHRRRGLRHPRRAGPRPGHGVGRPRRRHPGDARATGCSSAGPTPSASRCRSGSSARASTPWSSTSRSAGTTPRSWPGAARS